MILVLGLFNLFGQKVDVSSAESSGAQLEVSAPTKVRGGIFFQARFRIEAIEEIAECDARAPPGLARGHHVEHRGAVSRGRGEPGRAHRARVGRIPAGDEHRLYLHFQVNPTALGPRSQDVELYDGERLLLTLDRDAIVWP